jgi:anti-sigma B factor antagonist
MYTRFERTYGRAYGSVRSYRPAARGVHLAGALTSATATVLETALIELLNGQAKIVIELAGITHCDSTGVGLLAGAAAVATDNGGEVRLAGPSTTICAWLRVGGLMARVPTFLTVGGAVSADLLDLVATPDREPRPWTVAAGRAVAITRPSTRYRRTRACANQPQWRRPSR